MTELARRRATKDGRPVVLLRAVETLDGCRVEAELPEAPPPAPYVCATPREALAFLREAVETLTALGCELEG